MTRETGFYQAPPRTGAVQGATNSTGLSLGGLTLPEIRLRLPCIELPNVYRSRQGARMLVDAAQAPWVSTGVETVRVGPGATGSVSAEESGASRDGDAKSRGLPTSDCEDVKREYEDKVRELQRKIDDCEKLRRCIEDCLKTYPQGSAELTRRQNEGLVGGSSPPSAPAPAIPPAPLTAPPPFARSRHPNVSPVACCPPLPAVTEPLGACRVATLPEPQRLPPIAESSIVPARFSQVNYEAALEPHQAARPLAPERLPPAR